jgi:hypothetical protein
VLLDVFASFDDHRVLEFLKSTAAVAVLRNSSVPSAALGPSLLLDKNAVTSNEDLIAVDSCGEFVLFSSLFWIWSVSWRDTLFLFLFFFFFLGHDASGYHA